MFFFDICKKKAKNRPRGTIFLGAVRPLVAVECLRRLNSEALNCPKGAKQQAPLALSHTLSHQRLHARFIIHKVNELPQIEGTIAIPLSALDEYAFSRLTLRALDILLPSLLR